MPHDVACSPHILVRTNAVQAKHVLQVHVVALVSHTFPEVSDMNLFFLSSTIYCQATIEVGRDGPSLFWAELRQIVLLADEGFQAVQLLQRGSEDKVGVDGVVARLDHHVRLQGAAGVQRLDRLVQ